MEKEEKLKSRLYKIELIILKVLPFVLAVLALFSTLLDYFTIDSVIINYLMMITIYVFLYVSFYVFRFCEYHRMPIHYVVTVNLLSIYDVYIGMPIDTFKLLQLYIIVTCLFILITIYLYVKSHKRPSTKDSR